MKLLIISHTPHYRDQSGRLVGWGPTIREIDYLARIFTEVVHIAPLHKEPAPASSLPYQSANLSLRAVHPAGGEGLGDKLNILKCSGQYAKIIIQELTKADVVHVRCPANLSLLALLLLAGFRNPPCRWVKYAGNWRPGGPEPWSYKLQRWWLEKGLHKGIVTVNGRWPDQPSHVFSFYNPSLTQAEAEQAAAAATSKELRLPVYLLFVGRLEAAKGVGVALQVARTLLGGGLKFEFHLVGDGPERPVFERYVQQNGLSSCVHFHGWQPRPALAEYYTQAHFLIFPSSASEGWPKVLSEAMAYGVVPLAGAVSSIPQILAETGAGMALPPHDPKSYLVAMMDYIKHPEKWQEASLAGMKAALRFTYERYLENVKEIFSRHYGLSIHNQ